MSASGPWPLLPATSRTHLPCARTPRPIRAVPLSGRPIELRAHCGRNDDHVCVGLEPAHRRLCRGGPDQVQVHIRLDPQPVRRRFGAVHDMAHRRIERSDGADRGGGRGAERQDQLGRAPVKPLADPRHQLDARHRLSLHGEPASGPQRRVMDGVVQPGDVQRAADPGLGRRSPAIPVPRPCACPPSQVASRVLVVQPKASSDVAHAMAAAWRPVLLEPGTSSTRRRGQPTTTLP